MMDERRSEYRFPLILEVQYRTVQDFVVDYSENISNNGIFLATDKPLLVNTIVDLDLNLPNGPLVHVEGKVVRVIAPGQDGVQPGMAIQFFKFHKDAKTALRAYLHELKM